MQRDSENIDGSLPLGGIRAAQPPQNMHILLCLWKCVYVHIYHIFISNPSFLPLLGPGTTPASKERLCGAFLPLPPLPIPPKPRKPSFKLHFQLPRGLLLPLLLLEVQRLEPSTGGWSQMTAKNQAIQKKNLILQFQSKIGFSIPSHPMGEGVGLLLFSSLPSKFSSPCWGRKRRD